MGPHPSECCVTLCKNQKGKCGLYTTFHRFPFHQPLLMKTWIQNLRPHIGILSHQILVCSDHFTPDCFEEVDNYSGPRELRTGKVPTIFPEKQEEWLHQESQDQDEPTSSKKEPLFVISDVFSVGGSSSGQVVTQGSSHGSVVIQPNPTPGVSRQQGGAISTSIVVTQANLMGEKVQAVSSQAAAPITSRVLIQGGNMITTTSTGLMKPPAYQLELRLTPTQPGNAAISQPLSVATAGASQLLLNALKNNLIKIAPKPGPIVQAAVATVVKPGPLVHSPVATVVKLGPVVQAPVATVVKPGPLVQTPVATVVKPGPVEAIATKEVVTSGISNNDEDANFVGDCVSDAASDISGFNDSQDRMNDVQEDEEVADEEDDEDSEEENTDNDIQQQVNTTNLQTQMVNPILETIQSTVMASPSLPAVAPVSLPQQATPHNIQPQRIVAGVLEPFVPPQPTQLVSDSMVRPVCIVQNVSRVADYQWTAQDEGQQPIMPIKVLPSDVVPAVEREFIKTESLDEQAQMFPPYQSKVRVLMPKTAEAKKKLKMIMPKSQEINIRIPSAKKSSHKKFVKQKLVGGKIFSTSSEKKTVVDPQRLLSAGTPWFVCSKCDKVFIKKSKFDDHKKTHYEFKCSYGQCGEAFDTEAELATHAKTHLEKIGPKYTTDPNSSLRCEICNRVFAHKKYLDQHMLSHDNEYAATAIDEGLIEPCQVPPAPEPTKKEKSTDCDSA